MDKNTYKLDYTNVLGEADAEFSYEAASIKEAVDALVATFDKEFNAANIEFNAVHENGVDLGNDGLLEAEEALAEHYA